MIDIAENNDYCGVLLVNTGTPSEPQPRAIREYLGQFLMDPGIRPMNRVGWWFILHLFILPSRSRKNAERYQSIWIDEGSPFILDHDRIAAGLDNQFKEEGFNTLVRYAMSYGEPSIPKVLNEMREAGCNRLVVLPMYPQTAYSQAGCVKHWVKKALDQMHWDIPCDIVEGYSDNSTYIKAIAASLRNAGFDPDSDDKILFAFHSIPLTDIEAGDTYELQVDSTCLDVAGELGLDRDRWTIGYQCRFDAGRPWLEPYSTAVLERWAEADVGHIYYICPNFSVDCLETLYDVENEIKPHYYECIEQYGRKPADYEFTYVPCLNRSRAHLKVLADVLRPHVKGTDSE